MSRHGYGDDCGLDDWETIRWRGAVASAIGGKRGQTLLRELLVALDAMPQKRLITGALIDKDGAVCALGALGVARGVAMEDLDPEDYGMVAKAFGVAPALVQELEWWNDEHCDTPEARWLWMRKWVAKQIRTEVESQP